jgi:hypothetical protein
MKSIYLNFYKFDKIKFPGQFLSTHYENYKNINNRNYHFFVYFESVSLSKKYELIRIN